MQAVLAQYDIAFKTIVKTATFDECAITDLIRLQLDEIGDQVGSNHPMAGSDQIDWGDWIPGLPGTGVGQRITLDESVIRIKSSVRIDLEMGIKVGNRIIARDEM